MPLSNATPRALEGKVALPRTVRVYNTVGDASGGSTGGGTFVVNATGQSWPPRWFRRVR